MNPKFAVFRSSVSRIAVHWTAKSNCEKGGKPIVHMLSEYWQDLEAACTVAETSSTAVFRSIVSSIAVHWTAKSNCEKGGKPIVHVLSEYRQDLEAACTVAETASTAGALGRAEDFREKSVRTRLNSKASSRPCNSGLLLPLTFGTCSLAITGPQSCAGCQCVLRLIHTAESWHWHG